MSPPAVEVTADLGPDWLDVPPTTLGSVSASADRHILVTGQDGVRRRRFDLVGDGFDEYGFATEALLWRDLLVIGHGERLYVIGPSGEVRLALRLGIYFSGLRREGDDVLLATTGADILRLTPDGALAWRSAELGVDGVTIGEIADGVIEGQGEWDPPGGWRPFRIRLADGRPAG